MRWLSTLVSTVTRYAVESDGDLRARCEQIAVHRSGDYVYASNRGHDSVVRFACAAATGLTDPQHVSVFGMRPRHFSFVLGDTAMFVAKQSSGSVHAFRIPANGVPTPVGEVAAATGTPFVGSIVSGP